jgi:RHS repeat-associated protein
LSASFGITGASALGGGHDQGLIYDSGWVTVNVGSANATANFSGSATTAASIAAALAATLNTSSIVSASASGATINLTSKSTGAGTNYAVSNSQTYNTAKFSSPSFTASGSNMAGGHDYIPAVPPTGNGVWNLATPAVTKYTYSALDNLTCVEQHGNVAGTGCVPDTSGDATSLWRVRRFVYNSLSQLTDATNPESGHIGYAYNDDGTLHSNTDARNIAVTYAYDPSHRVTVKTYSNGDPTVAYSYDQTLYSIGKRTSMSDASGSTSWSYDLDGRPILEQRTISGITKLTGHGYNLDGSLASLTYPSGEVVTYVASGAGHELSVADNTLGINYASNAHYAPSGGIANAAFGVTGSFTGINLVETYNQRLQPDKIMVGTSNLDQTNCNTVSGKVLHFVFGYNTSTANNGNVIGITNCKDSSRSQNFTYDGLNRIGSAQTTNSGNWGNSYVYDAWGNLLQKNPIASKTNSEPLTVTANLKNRLDQMTYDPSGSVLNDGSHNYVYDAEERISSLDGVPNSYIYDGNGDRVKKSSGTLYWGAGPLAESDLTGNITKEFVFFGGKRIARRDANGSVHYYFSDHLGSSNVVTNSSGVSENESDFYPWGREIVVQQSIADQNYKFTGKERDSESGLDLMGLRYYGSALGRFTSPDPEFASPDRIADPQQWNMYAYVRNNPLAITDPTGLDFSLTCSGGNTATCQNGIQGQTTTDANGKSTFTATDVDMNDSKDASAGYHDQFGNQYTGSFDQNNGVSFTNTATGATSLNSRFIDGSDETDVNGSTTGAFNGIQGRFNSNCGGSCEAKGSLYDLPGHPNAVSALEKMIGKSFVDNLNFFGEHGKANNYRFGTGQLTHIVDHLDGLDKGKQEVHFEGHAPGSNLQNFVLHQVDAMRDSSNHQSSQEPRLP